MTEEWNKNNDAGDDDVQIPLGTGAGESAGSDAGYTDGIKPKINNSTLALFAAFAAALIVLYLLGLQNKPRPAGAQQQDATNLVGKYINSHGEGTTLPGDDIAKLRQTIDKSLDNATPSSPLAGNPFAQAPVRVDSGPAPVAANPDARDVAVEFSTLNVQTIMFGRTPMAMINGQLVTPGTQLGSFLVSEIQPNAVLLKYKDASYKLELNVPTKGRP